MAFLCPGALKGRADYEDLEFQFTSGLNKTPEEERKAVASPQQNKVRLIVTNNFQPTVDDEMGVVKGEIVFFLYRENEWNYVVNDRNQEGFIPAAYCVPYPPQSQPENNSQKPPAKNSLRGSTRSLSSLFKIRSKSHQDLNRSAEAISYGLDSDLLPKPKLAGSTDDLLTSPRGAKIVSQKGVEKVSQFLKSLEELPVEEENTEVGDTFLHSSHQNLTYEGGKLTSELTKSVPPATVNDGYLVANINRQPSISTGIGQFLKKPMGQFVVNFDFLPTCPQDLAVTKGQVVTALNCDDPDWIFVRTASGHEGFVPHNYISPFDQSAKDLEGKSKVPLSPDWRKLTELLVIANFFPEAQDDLTIVSGDRLYTQQKCEGLVDLNCFVWAFSPRLNQHGFVPLSHVSLVALN